MYEFCVGDEWYCQLQYPSVVVYSGDAGYQDVMVLGSYSSQKGKILLVGVQYARLPIFKCYEHC